MPVPKVLAYDKQAKRSIGLVPETWLRVFPNLVLDDGRLTEPAQAERPVELAKLKVSDLKALAAERGVDLGDATKKADILALIEAAGEPHNPIEAAIPATTNTAAPAVSIIKEDSDAQDAR